MLARAISMVGGSARLRAERVRCVAARSTFPLLLALVVPGWLALMLLVGAGFLIQHLVTHHGLRHTALARTRDTLTGLDDAGAFRCFVHDELGAGGLPLGLLFLELRHVGLLRSTFGREAVETVCKTVATRLRRVVRSRDRVAHFGDGLFAVALNGVACRDALATAAERLRHEVSQSLLVAGTPIRPVWHAAAALAPHDGQTATDLLVAAEAARELAGTGCGQELRWLPASARASIASRRSLQRELIEAKDTGAFFPVFQPQLDLRTGRICRVEVLMRWQRNDGRVAGPADFLDRLRVLDALPAVSRNVYGAALAEAALWRQQGAALHRVALNLDSTQVAGPDWSGALLELIARSPLDPTAVEFEVSENILHDTDMKGLVAGLQQLRDAGAIVSLDDFGTGFSSLTQIAELPIDLVKLDARLLWDACRSERTCTVIEGIVALVERLGLPCVFEGVETPEQLRLVRDFGGAFAQGFLIGRPMSGPDAEMALARAAPQLPERHAVGAP